MKLKQKFVRYYFNSLNYDEFYSFNLRLLNSKNILWYKKRNDGRTSNFTLSFKHSVENFWERNWLLLHVGCLIGSDNSVNLIWLNLAKFILQKYQQTSN